MALDLVPVLELVSLVVIVVVVFWVLLPALVDALQYLLVGFVYVSVVVSALLITAVVFLTIFIEPDEPDIDDLTNETICYLDTTSFWIWTRWT